MVNTYYAVSRLVRPHAWSRACIVIGLASLVAPSTQAQSYLIRGWNGTTAGDFLGSGHQVSGVGDLNGDGFAEVLVGADQVNTSGIGYAKVYSGADGKLLFSFVPPAGVHRLGVSVSGLGDLNADLVPDLIVGSMGTSEGFVFSGADGSLLCDLTGSGPYPESTVRGAGDIDGDGVPDVLVGKACGSGGPTNRLRIFSGAGCGLIRQITGSTCFGVAAGVGDIDGDNLDDILVGARFPDPGQAFVYSGGKGNVLFTFTGPGTGRDRFGGQVSGPGDVTGDGIPDFLIGASTADPNGMSDAGQAFVYSGADGSLVHTFDGAAPGDQFGSVARGSAADMNGDGFPDVVVGAAQDDTGPGYVKVFSGATGTLLFTLTGTNFDDLFGSSVALDDVNGDGLADVIVGIPGADPVGLVDAGRVEVHSLVGIPQGSDLFGNGCPGSNGNVPLIQTAWGEPSLGNSEFAVVLSKAAGDSPCLLMLGGSRQSWLGLPLPLGLASIGLPACFLNISPDAIIAAQSTGKGIVFTGLPIPSIPALSGVDLYLQWLIADPAGPISLTEGLQLVIR